MADHVDDAAGFEWPPHLQKWFPAAMSHFDFHNERCRVAPDRMKLAEIQRMTDCTMCPDDDPNDLVRKFARLNRPQHG